MCYIRPPSHPSPPPESRRDQEEGGELDSQEKGSPEEIKRREVVLGCRERELDFFCFSLLPNGGATDIVFVTLFCTAVGTAIAWCCGRCATPDGHRLNILLFWRRSTAYLVFRVGACFEVSLFCPPLFPLVPPSLTDLLASVEVKQQKSINPTPFRVQELCESRGGRPGLPSLISLRFLWT